MPESMGGNSCPPWQELPEQAQQQTGGYGVACDAVMSLRDQVGLLKKQLSGLATPMKEYIYVSAPASRIPIEDALAKVDSTATAISNAAKAAADAAAADTCLDSSLKAEAVKVLNAVRSDAIQQAADSRALCLVTAEKADADSEKRQQDQEPQTVARQEFAKELYGDFNLQLGPVTRKMFSAQTKLLALVKNIKKQRASSVPSEDDMNN